MIDRGGPGQAVGEALLEHAHVLVCLVALGAGWHVETLDLSILCADVARLLQDGVGMGQSERLSEDGSHVSGITGAGGVVDVRAGGRHSNPQIMRREKPPRCGVVAQSQLRHAE